MRWTALDFNVMETLVLFTHTHTQVPLSSARAVIIRVVLLLGCKIKLVSHKTCTVVHYNKVWFAKNKPKKKHKRKTHCSFPCRLFVSHVAFHMLQYSKFRFIAVLFEVVNLPTRSFNIFLTTSHFGMLSVHDVLMFDLLGYCLLPSVIERHAAVSPWWLILSVITSLAFWNCQKIVKDSTQFKLWKIWPEKQHPLKSSWPCDMNTQCI